MSALAGNLDRMGSNAMSPVAEIAGPLAQPSRPKIEAERCASPQNH
jgi:hypothetical protein